MSVEVAVFPWMLDATGLKKEKKFFETRVVEYQNGDALSWERAESMSVERTQNRLGVQSLPKPARDGSWIALVIGSSMLFSLVLACATPFAAIVAVAGGTMCRRDAAILVCINLLALAGLLLLYRAALVLGVHSHRPVNLSGAHV